jgi:hypothetical protein
MPRGGATRLAQIALLSLAAGCGGELIDIGEEEEAEAEEIDSTQASMSLDEHTARCQGDPRVTLGLVSLNVCVGAELFFREPFGGNGRTCATCHPAENNFTIEPAFISTLPNSDPLFIAEQVTALRQLERPDLMRNFGLILENVDGLADPTRRFTMRSVPHTFSLGVSVTPSNPPADGSTIPPQQRTGWSGDGAPGQGALRDFQTGAIIQHYTKSLSRRAGIDFVLATSAELDRIVAFMATIGRTNEINLANVRLSDSNAEAGRVLFLSAGARCNGCHANAGANVANGANFNFDTGVERARVSNLNSQAIPFDGGFGGANLGTPNFDSNRDGANESFGNGRFNTPPLIEAADTGPFFHTNASQTIEDAVRFYTTPAFTNSPTGNPPIVLDATQIARIGKFLRVVNGAFNAQLALKRLPAVLSIISAFGDSHRSVQRGLIDLAYAEVIDAYDVLYDVDLNPAATTDLDNAARALLDASSTSSASTRRSKVETAQALIRRANNSLSASSSAITALTFNMGAGTLMF